VIFWFKPIRWILFGIVLLCLVHEARGLDPNRLPSQYVREEWIRASRFPGGAVNTIGQTADGYLWIGTDKGLIRFDGFNFKFVSFTSDTTASKVPILLLLVDAAGKLWLRPQGTDVLRQVDGKFENVTYGAEALTSQITAVSKDSNGGVLLSDIAKGTFRFKGDEIQRLAAPTVLPGSSPVISMAETAEGKIWMGTLGAGLFLFADGRAGKIDAGLPDRKINCLLPISNEELWVGTDTGLYHGNDKGLRRAELPSSLGSVQVLSMLRDRDSNIWVGTTRGLLRINAKGTSFSEENELRGDGGINVLFEDREGNLWIGGARGLGRIRDSAFVTYSSVSDRRFEHNGPVYVDPEGRTWLAPAQGGLYVLQNGRVQPVTSAIPANEVVYSIRGRGDEVWAGRQRGGLTRLQFRNGAIGSQSYTVANGLAHSSYLELTGKPVKCSFLVDLHRTTVVKPYLQPEIEQTNKESDNEKLTSDVPRRNPERTRRLPAGFRQNTSDISIFIQDSDSEGQESFETGIFEYTSPPFSESRRKEINGLLEKEVFEVIDIATIPGGVRIFNSRCVDEIKNPGTDKAFEKSRPVVQAYNDQGKIWS